MVAPVLQTLSGVLQLSCMAGGRLMCFHPVPVTAADTAAIAAAAGHAVRCVHS